MCIEGVAVVSLLVNACTLKDPDSSCGQMQLRLAFMPVGFIHARVSYLCLKSFEQSGSDCGGKVHPEKYKSVCRNDLSDLSKLLLRAVCS